MSDYQNILVATAFHNEDLPVLKKAIELAKQYGAKLTVVNVVPNVPYYMASGLSSISDIEDRLEDESREKLAEAKQLISEEGLDADYQLFHGSSRLEILRAAKTLQTDLIVIGSHGKHGVQRLLGSTAAGVLHRAKCDVLVVRAKK